MCALFQQDLCPPTINQGSHKPGHIQGCQPDSAHTTQKLTWLRAGFNFDGMQVHCGSKHEGMEGNNSP